MSIFKAWRPLATFELNILINIRKNINFTRKKFYEEKLSSSSHNLLLKMLSKNSLVSLQKMSFSIFYFL